MPRLSNTRENWARWAAAISSMLTVMSASAVAGGATATADEVASVADRRGQALGALVEEYYEEMLRLNPILATFNGDHRYNDRFAVSISPGHRSQALALEQRYLKQIDDFDPAGLNDRDRTTWEIFRFERSEQIRGYDFPSHLIPVNQFSSVPSFLAQMGSGDTVQPFETIKDYENWLSRVGGWPAWVDQAIANMRVGIETGVVQPRAVVLKVLPQLESHLVDEVTRSVFYRPVAEMPESFPAEERRRLTALFETSIRERIIPAYRKLHTFVREEYLERSRSRVGLSDLPGGTEWYAHMVQVRTSTSLTPQEIHEIGRSEVQRIGKQMSQVRSVVDAMKLPPSLGYRSEDEMLAAYRELRQSVHASVARLFNEFPQADYEIRAVEPFRQRSAAGASYMAAAPDGSRPGVFYVNTRGWQGRTRAGTEALFLHEAVPGHHFQISIQRESGDLPRFRRFGRFTAYTEGWGLYAESLGPQLGLYRDPRQKLAALGSEMFRARRLVVDTGIHAMGWSRRRAIDYLGSESEVERYIVLPAQALAYKIGQLKISELRGRAERRLGKGFDIREFHTLVLGSGAMPLDLLERNVERWLARQDP